MYLSVNVRLGCYQGRLLVFVVYQRVRVTYNASHVERNQVFITNIAAHSTAFLVLATRNAALDTVQPVSMNMLWYNGLALIQLL